MKVWGGVINRPRQLRLRISFRGRHLKDTTVAILLFKREQSFFLNGGLRERKCTRVLD